MNANSNSKNFSANANATIRSEKKNQVVNNYCTARTINEPRDLYNEKIEDYQFLQDRNVHDSARLDVNPVNGHVGCLGCEHQKPTCPTKTGFAYPEHVGVESRLFGL